MISKACYVTCDNCGDPAGVSTEGAKLARAYARAEGFVRVRVMGKMVDLCVRCRPEESVADERVQLKQQGRMR